MTNPMWGTIEEVRSLQGFTETNFQTLSILSLVNQDITGSTNLTLSTDEAEYIVVHFKQNLDADFKKLFIKQAMKYNKLIKWYKCPSNKCKDYYSQSQKQDLVEHFVEYFKDDDHPFVKLEDCQTDTYSFTYDKIFWMKKCKYYDLSPIIRQFVFDKIITEEQEVQN